MAREKPLADLVQSCLGPALAKQGFAAGDVIVAWPDIVGERLARVTQPVRLEWPRRSRFAGPDERAEPATLVVRVESAFALEMQHAAPTILERVNGYYGWRCVGRLVLKQGPVRRGPVARAPAPELGAAEQAKIHAAVEDVADDALRAALDRLGHGVLGSAGRHRS
jgi:hypothetical protein